jgi:hypothetical protein
MSKRTFGIVAGLALTVSPAWAGDEKPEAKVVDESAASESAASLESTKASESAAGRVIEVASARRALTESKDVRASHEERWLLEREGYRDGGY